MMKRWWNGMIRGAVLAVTLATAALTAAPLAQAAVVYRVDDDSSAACAPTYNGSSHVNPLQDAINDAKTNHVKTILVCPGTYPPFTVDTNTLGLTIKALDPADRPKVDAPLAHGVIITVNGSKNIVLDGLFINGEPFDDTATEPMTGVLFQNSSGAVQNSLIYDLRDHPTLSAASGYGIDVENYGSTSLKMTIKNNMISAFGYTAVNVYGPVKLIISGNHIDGVNGDTAMAPSYGININPTDLGVPTGAVTNNLFYFVGTGLYLHDVNSFKVSNNVFRQNVYDGVFINSQCGDLGGGSGTNASKNSVTNNRFLQMNSGIDVYAGSVAWSECPPHTDNTVIAKNTFSSNGFVMPAAVNIIAQKNSTDTPRINKTKVTNNTAWGFNQMISVTEIGGSGMVTNTIDSHNTLVHP